MFVVISFSSFRRSRFQNLKGWSKGHSHPAKKYIGPVFMFGHASDNRIPDVLIAWNEPDRRSDGKIGPKISSCIAGESEDSMTAAVTGGSRCD
jgi:hypothetical protein